MKQTVRTDRPFEDGIGLVSMTILTLSIMKTVLGTLTVLFSLLLSLPIYAQTPPNFYIPPADTPLVFDKLTEGTRFGVYSPDGQTVVTTGSRHGDIWNPLTGSIICDCISSQTGIKSIAYRPDGKVYIMTDYRLNLVISEFKPDAQFVALPSKAVYLDAEYSPDGTAVVSSHSDSVVFWRTSDWTVQGSLIGPVQGMRRATFTSDGGHILTTGYDGAVRVWDIASGKATLEIPNKSHPGELSPARFDPTESRIAFVTDSVVNIADAHTGSILLTLRGHKGLVGEVAFSPNGKWIASGSADSTIRLWDAKTGALIHVFIGHTNAVYSVSFSPDGSKLLTGADDGTARVWPLTRESSVKSVCSRRDFRIMPNVIRDQAVVDFSIERQGFVDVDVVDLRGFPVAVLNRSFYEPGSYSTTVSFPNLAAGEYFLRICSLDGIEVRGIRIVK